MVRDVFEENKGVILRGLKDIEKDLKSSIKHSQDAIGNLTMLVKEQAGEIKKHQAEINTLKSDKMKLEIEVISLKSKLNDLDQYGRLETVEIYGIPNKRDENVAGLVVNVFKAMAVDINESDISVCHRLRRLPDRMSSGVIAKMVRRDDVLKVLAAKNNKKLTVRDIGMSGQNPTFVNVSLSRSRRVLLAKAREMKKAGQWKYVWTDRSGDIKIRVEDNGRVYVVKSEDDLNKVE